MANLTAWAAANLGLLVAVTGALLLVLLAVTGILIVRLAVAEKRWRALTKGTNGANLERLLQAEVDEMRAAGERVRALDELARRLERDARGHLQRVGFVRFNPFRDAGGDQSFVLALADRDGNGAVVSSLHSRDTTRIYGKPLLAWDSVYALTDEEKQVIEKARRQG